MSARDDRTPGQPPGLWRPLQLAPDLGSTLRAFAGPLLDCAGHDADLAELQHAVELAATIWNGVPASGQGASYLDDIRALFGERVPVPLMQALELLVLRRLDVYATDPRVIGPVRIDRLPGGELVVWAGCSID